MCVAGCRGVLGIDERKPLPADVTIGGGGSGGDAAGGGATGGHGGQSCAPPLDTDIDNCGAEGNVCSPRSNSVPDCEACACTFTCNVGYGDCDGDASNGCETDLRVSNTHCGACGFGCEAPGCDDGACILSNGNSRNVVLYEGDLYYTAIGVAVDRCAITGCALAPERVSSGGVSGTSYQLHVDDVGMLVKARNADQFYTCSDHDACVWTDLMTFPVSSFDADADHIVWIAQAEVMRMPRTGGAVETLLTTADAGYAVLIEGSELYYGTHRELARCDMADCAGTSVVLHAGPTGTFSSVRNFALDPDWLYYAVGDDILRTPRDGSGGIAPVATATSLRMFVVEGDGVYSIQGEDLRRAPVDGGASELLEVLPSYANALVVDDQFFYVGTANALWRIPRWR